MKKILNEDYLNSLSDKAVENVQELQTNISKIIGNRVEKVPKNVFDDYGDRKKIEFAIQEAKEKQRKTLFDTYYDLAVQNDLYAEEMYIAKGLRPLTVETDEFLAYTVNSIAESVNNALKFEYSSLFYKVGDNIPPQNINEAYNTLISEAIANVDNGILDYGTAMKSVIGKMGEGLFIYQSGKKTRLDSAVRMNVLDGAKKLNQRAMDYHGSAFGSDGIELSAHQISAPDHAPVQGHQFTNEQFELMQNGHSCVDVNGVVYDGFDRPIGEWNCKHFAFPILVGISEQTVDDKTLQEYAKQSEKKYPLTQIQRDYELRLRKLKSECVMFESAGDKFNAQRLQGKIKDLQSEYKHFSIKNGLSYQPNRARVIGWQKRY